MINYIRTYFSERARRKQLEISILESERILAVSKVIAENVELRTICINNVSYIESYINVLSANINHAKGTNAAATNRKRKSMRDRITWLTSKLAEEKAMIEYYCATLKSLSSTPN